MLRLFVLLILLVFMRVCSAAPLLNLDIQSANLSDAVRLLAKFLQLNVIVSANVTGMTTLHLQQADPKAAFDLLLASENLAVKPLGNILWVATRDELLKQQQAEMQWQASQLQTEQLQSITWQAHYARAVDIARLLQTQQDSLLTKRGIVRVDARTNILYVQDVTQQINTIRSFIRRLDVPIKQVQIKARLASVDSDQESMLGVRFAVSGNEGASVVQGEYSVAVAHLPDGSMLDAKLAALEQSGHAELISSPQLFTANLQTAQIEAGQEVPYQEVSESGGTAVVFKKAVLGLKVTPQVLPGNKVLLQLEISQDRPSQQLVLGMPTITTRQIKTTVLTKAGQTIVLGGIYEENQENGQQRIPFISRIPLLGRLFTDDITSVTKRELLIFITPKVSTEAI
jgi:type IV pilus assembly protein PilQ